MTYPDPVYFGEGGEVSAVYRPASQEAELKIGPLTEARYLITGEATKGKFGLYRWDMAPGTPGAAPHFHRTLAESFFILSGTVGLYDGATWVDAGPGDYLYVPEGGLHAFRNQSGEAASMLILFAPGAPREGYFEGLADRAMGKREFTQDQFKEFCDAHDNIWV